MRLLLKLAGWGAFVVALIAFPAGYWIAETQATVAFEVSAFHSPEEVELFRQDYAQAIANESIKPLQVANIYGKVVSSEPQAFLFVDESRTLRPNELENVVLFRVERDKQEDPWTPGRLRLVAGIASSAALGFAVVCLILLRLLPGRAAE